MPEQPTHSHWVCQTCKLPITGHSGVIEIINTNPDLGEYGSYPREATPDRSAALENASAAEMIKDLQTPHNIGFLVFHAQGCDPHPENEGYNIGSGRVLTMEDWCGWVFQVSHKTWMGRDDMERMLRFWWDHKGARVPGP